MNILRAFIFVLALLTAFAMISEEMGKEETKTVIFSSSNNYPVVNKFFELQIENKTTKQFRINPFVDFDDCELKLIDLNTTKEVPLTLYGQHLTDKNRIKVFPARGTKIVSVGGKGVIQLELTRIFDLSMSSEYLLKGKVLIYMEKPTLVDIGDLKFKIVKGDIGKSNENEIRESH